MLVGTNADVTQRGRAAFAGRLAELGWRERVNIDFEVRYAEGIAANFEPLAAEMVARKPDLIWAAFGPFAAVVKKHTRNIPIVFANADDPVGLGLVASLARPGGNATGPSTRSTELIGKRLQLLKETLPSLSRIGVVRRVGILKIADSELQLEELKRAAAKLGLQVIEVQYEHSRPEDLGPAFAELAGKRVEAVASVLRWNFIQQREFARHAAQARLATICDTPEFVEAGALMSYSVNLLDHVRKSAEYVNRILRGTKPADLPVEEPTVFELVVNQKTARALGIKIPQTVLLRADRVIE